MARRRGHDGGRGRGSPPLSAGLPIVRLATSADDDAWDAFVRGQPEATPHHAVAWRRVVATLGHRAMDLIAVSGDSVRGVLPLCLADGLRGRALVSVAGASYASILAGDAETRDALGREAIALARTHGAHHVELRSLGGAAPGDFDSTSPCVRVVIPVSRASLPKETRRQLRIAGKADLEIVSHASADELYAPYLASMERHGSPPFDTGFFRAILDAFGKDAEVLVARHAGRPVASELWLQAGRTRFSAYGGATGDGRRLRAGYALLDAALRSAADAGVTELDLGRSFRRSPSLSFKKEWGGRVEPVFFHVHSLDGRRHAPLDPESMTLRVASAGWRLLPRALQRRLGPLLVRRLH